MDNFNNILSQPFYNNIKLTEDQWQGENKKSLFLQTVIFNVYKSNPGIKISGWQMRDYLAAKLNKRVNINSVRRSISNLKNEFKVSKTEDMRLGNEGKNEHYYVLAGTIDKIHTYSSKEKSAGDIASSLLDSMKKTLVQKDLFGE